MCHSLLIIRLAAKKTHNSIYQLKKCQITEPEIQLLFWENWVLLNTFQCQIPFRVLRTPMIKSLVDQWGTSKLFIKYWMHFLIVYSKANVTFFSVSNVILFEWILWNTYKKRLDSSQVVLVCLTSLIEIPPMPSSGLSVSITSCWYFQELFSSS